MTYIRDRVDNFLHNANHVVHTNRVGTDADPYFQRDAQGKHEWGSGTGATDVTLYRGAANQLKTDDLFDAAGGFRDGLIATSGSPTNGTLNMSGTATAFTLGAPTAGDILEIVQTSTATGGKTVTTDSTSTTFTNGSNRIATFNGKGDALRLKALSATQWAVMSNVGSVAFS